MFRANPNIQITSMSCENEALVRGFLQIPRVEDVKRKLSCDASFQVQELKMWKRSFCARLPSNSKSAGYENESFVRLRCFALLYSTLLCSKLLSSPLLYSTLPYLYSTLLCSTLLHSTLLCSALFYSALLYSTLLYPTLLYSTLHMPTGHNDLCFVMIMFSTCQLDTVIFVL